MEKWEKALYEFLKRYQNRPYFEGAILCGSYAAGNQNKFSDIDVQIVISDKQNWRERGNVKVGGFLIEYFINPIRRIHQEFEKDVATGRQSCASMFGYGKIIADKKGNVKLLQDEAVQFLKKQMPKYKLTDFSFDCYGAWDLMDELNSLSKDKKALGLVYYKLLEKLMDMYFRAQRIPKMPLTKMERIMTDSRFAKRYHIQKLPDQTFIKLFLVALCDMKVIKIKKLYDFVIKSVGGFDISDFKLHSKLDS